MVFGIQEFFVFTREFFHLLKKFYLYKPRNYEHLTQEIWGCLWMTLQHWDKIIKGKREKCSFDEETVPTLWESKSGQLQEGMHTPLFWQGLPNNCECRKCAELCAGIQTDAWLVLIFTRNVGQTVCVRALLVGVVHSNCAILTNVIYTDCHCHNQWRILINILGTPQVWH